MHPSFLAILSLLLAPLLGAETFRTLDGTLLEGRLSGVYGDIVVIATKNGSYTVRVDVLDDASLGGVAGFLATAPKVGSTPWSRSDSPVAKAVARRLLIPRAGKLEAFDPGERPEPEFYLIYFGAHWCGPCRRFSPELVRTYHALKAQAPDLFEVIFVSDDEDARGQLAYVNEAQMPWPVLRYGSQVSLFDRWRGRGIPCLVVINRTGDLIFHSYRGEEYLGADDPLAKFQGLVELHADPSLPAPSRHRLAVAAHRLTAGQTDRRPQLYHGGIDLARNQTLPKLSIPTRVAIDARGRVQEVEFQIELPFIAAEQLRRAMEQWLFLPAIKAGQPVASSVVLEVDNTK